VCKQFDSYNNRLASAKPVQQIEQLLKHLTSNTVKRVRKMPVEVGLFWWPTRHERSKTDAHPLLDPQRIELRAATSLACDCSSVSSQHRASLACRTA
jgi:hypothetical protein